MIGSTEGCVDTDVSQVFMRESNNVNRSVIGFVRFCFSEKWSTLNFYSWKLSSELRVTKTKILIIGHQHSINSIITFDKFVLYIFLVISVTKFMLRKEVIRSTVMLVLYFKNNFSKFKLNNEIDSMLSVKV